MKDNIFIHPGVKRPESAKTHASVCSYFLIKYLSKHFNVLTASDLSKDSRVIKAMGEAASKSTVDTLSSEASGGKSLVINSMADAIDVADKSNIKIDYIMSPFQRGFTRLSSKSRNKSELDRIARVKKKHNSKIVSVHDHSALRDYYEDILFTALPFKEERRIELLKRTNTDLIYMGWCADHKVFVDKKKKNGDLNIVLDHAALQSFRVDASPRYLKAIRRIKSKYPNKKIHLCRLKGGFEFYDFKKRKWTHDLSLRWWSSKYDKGWKNGSGCHIFQIAECLNSSHIFCVTHVESCGLTGIEAFMSGCKVYIPSGEDTFQIWGSGGKTNTYKGTFLKKILLKPYMDYSTFDLKKTNELLGLLERDVSSFSVKSNRLKLMQNNSWESAALKIFYGLKNK